MKTWTMGEGTALKQNMLGLGRLTCQHSVYRLAPSGTRLSSLPSKVFHKTRCFLTFHPQKYLWEPCWVIRILLVNPDFMKWLKQRWFCVGSVQYIQGQRVSDVTLVSTILTYPLVRGRVGAISEHLRGENPIPCFRSLIKVNP